MIFLLHLTSIAKRSFPGINRSQSVSSWKAGHIAWHAMTDNRIPCLDFFSAAHFFAGLGGESIKECQFWEKISKKIAKNCFRRIGKGFITPRRRRRSSPHWNPGV